MISKQKNTINFFVINFFYIYIRLFFDFCFKQKINIFNRLDFIDLINATFNLKKMKNLPRIFKKISYFE